MTESVVDGAVDAYRGDGWEVMVAHTPSETTTMVSFEAHLRVGGELSETAIVQQSGGKWCVDVLSVPVGEDSADGSEEQVVSEEFDTWRAAMERVREYL